MRVGKRYAWRHRQGADGRERTMPIIMTEPLARAAAWDEGNRSMRRAGRKVWNVDDWNAAAAEYARLWPEERDHAVD